MGKNMKRCLSLLLLIFILTIPLYALENNVAPRPAGMGNAFSTVAKSPDSINWNPAGLSGIAKPVVSTSFADIFGVDYNNISCAVPLPFGVVGVNFFGASLKDIPNTALDASGRPAVIGNPFNYGENQLTIGVSNKIKSLAWGCSVKVISENVKDNAASGCGMDLGIIYDFNPKYSFGVSLQNLVRPQMKWNTSSGHVDEGVFILRLGNSYKVLEDQWIVALDCDLKKNYEPIYRLGSEYWLHQILAIRAGWDNGFLSFGTGFKYRNFSLDYSYSRSKNDFLENIHRLSLGLEFIFNKAATKNPENILPDKFLPETRTGIKKLAPPTLKSKRIGHKVVSHKKAASQPKKKGQPLVKSKMQTMARNTFTNSQESKVLLNFLTLPGTLDSVRAPKGSNTIFSGTWKTWITAISLVFLGFASFGVIRRK